jgi:hypothetical protein
MAFIYINDATPFAEEYESNYFYFDANDPNAYREAIKILKKRVIPVNKKAPIMKNQDWGLANSNKFNNNPALY